MPEASAEIASNGRRRLPQRWKWPDSHFLGIATPKGNDVSSLQHTNTWDLVLLAFAWAPLDDPSFVARIGASLCTGGRVVVEHFTQPAGQQGPNPVRTLAPNLLRTRFEGFEMAFYEEAVGVGDWGGPGSQLVRMITVKR